MVEDMKKPFTMDFDYATLIKEGEEERKAKQQQDLDKTSKKFTKPFTMDKNYAQSKEEKLYLVLLVYTTDNEDIHDFMFIIGRQNVYDKMKELLETTAGEHEQLDAMRSLIFVDSPKIQISNKLSLFKFMKDMKFSNKIKDESSFDIDDYFYEYEEEDNGRD